MMGKEKKDPYKEIADSLDIEPDNIELGSQFIEGEVAKADNDKTHSGSISDSGDDNKVFEKVERELKVEQEKCLRLQAEMENIRKRGLVEVSNARKYAIESFATNLISVADSLEKALSTEEQSIEHLKSGVQLTLKQMAQAFERASIVSIQPDVGEKFDPNWHQAVSTKSIEQLDDGFDVGAVCEVLQKGYKISDRVIRPAIVVVSG
jgi:molecular chaperone GrpE